MKKGNFKHRNLNISIIPYSEISGLSSVERIKKLLGIVLSGRIVVLQGKLKTEEESRLIEDTMALIGHVPGFKGIELAVLTNESLTLKEKITGGIAKILIGNRDAMTVIGPAGIVKEIKKDPKKLEIMLR